MKDSTTKRSNHISTLASQTTSVVSIALVLLILGVMACLVVGARNATEAVRSSLAMTVNIHAGASDYDIKTLRAALTKAPYSAETRYVSAAEVLAQESKFIGDSTLTLLDGNPYNAEIQVRLCPEYLSADSIAKITTSLTQKYPAAESVVAQSDVADSVSRNMNTLMLIPAAVALALLLISFVLINNTISVAIYGRRFVIHTMKLVGARRGFIRRPFVRMGITAGLCGAIIASAILCGARAYLPYADTDVAAMIGWNDVALICAALAVCGMAVCGLAAAWSANRYLNKNYDQLFKK